MANRVKYVAVILVLIMGMFDAIAEILAGQKAKQNVVSGAHCVPKAAYDAVMWNKEHGDDTVIAISKLKKTDTEDVDHAQAMANIKGKLTPLTSHDSDGIVRPWNPHFPEKKPYRYVDVDTFMTEQKDNIGPGLTGYLMNQRRKDRK